MTADTLVRTIAAAIILAASLSAAPAVARGQDLRCDPGDAEVRGLNFTGNRTFTQAELANVIVTTPSSWARRYLNLPFSTRRCLDPAEFGNDRLRLILYYRRRGFPAVTVDTALRPSGAGGVTAGFRIHEGEPVILRSLVVTGLDSVRNPREVTGDLPIRMGQRFDRTKIDAAIDVITRRLRNEGYPAVRARTSFVVDTAARVAYDSLVIDPGALTRLGGVHINVTPAPNKRQHISDPVVRRVIGLDSGAIFREQAIIDAQRSLYQTDAYTHVSIALDSARGFRVGTDSVAPLDITLAENTLHAARIGGGYGTLDCFRANGELDDYNFLKGARHLTLQGRVSKIGIGKPLDFAPGVCSSAQKDPYSTRLNYYLGATLRQPIFFGLRSVPTVTAYTSRVSEYNAYVRTTSIGGIASVEYQRWARTPITLGYTVDFGRTEAQPALFCAVFNLCAREDRERVQQNQRLAVVSALVLHDASNNILAPTTGSIARLEVRIASPVFLSDAALQFNTLLGEASRYLPVGGGNVLALHARGGAVFGAGFKTNTGFIPPQERMYAGGPNSVRGFAQNELGGATYLAQRYDTVRVERGDGSTDTYFRVADTVSRARRFVAVGGNTLAVGNVELRLRSPVLPDVLQFAVFADAGDVWNRGGASTFGGFHIKVTPGIQVAALTPVGPARIVVGYNPYRRPLGPIYYENTAAQGGALPCVSPRNTLPVTTDSTGALVQSEGRCEASFHPAANTSFGSRLTFGLAIGQAF
ncbi:MAG: BamA/OMP85 family outer membrane protein [Gemmatimonadaceae bacterium]